MRFGSLFAGIGGMDLGLERAGMECRWQVEIDPFARRVLEKHWPDVKRYEDVRTVEWEGVERVDIIVGGFPCQDVSNAGRRAGLAGRSSGLWREVVRCVAATKPAAVLVENSAHGRKHWMCPARDDLRSLGYEAVAFEVSAFDLGANHERRRGFILADARRGRCALAEEALRAGRPSSELRSWWASEPGIRRVDDGVPERVDRCRVLGNAVVPQVAEWIGRRILEADAAR